MPQIILTNLKDRAF